MVLPDYLSLTSICLNHGEDWVNERNRRKPWRGLIVLLPVRGNSRLEFGSSVQVLEPGDVLIGQASSPFHVRPTSSGGMAFLCFIVLAEHLFPILAGHELIALHSFADNLRPPRHYPARSPIASACHRLIRDVSADSGFENRCRLLRVVGVVLQAELKGNNPGHTGAVRNEEDMSEALASLTVAELSKLSVEELARRFGCGRRQLNRLFQQYAGRSVAELKMEMRLVYAAFLLCDPEAKTTAVAGQCGFNHLGLFNTCFKRRFKMNPGEFRKRVLSGPNSPVRLIKNEPGCWVSAHGLCPWSDDSRGGHKP